MRKIIRLLPVLVALSCTPGFADPPATSVELLLDTDLTVLKEAFAYPNGRSRITATRITLPPGASVPLHLHPVPLFAYILQGELVVDYGSQGTRTYRKGDAFVEAFHTPHSGHNGGKGNLQILAVYAGAEGTPNSIALEPGL